MQLTQSEPAPRSSKYVGIVPSGRWWRTRQSAMAFAFDMPLVLVTVGILYIIETLSDIIQVGYFKLSHGKRVFRMAPFHHHLEMGGWTGKKWKEKELFALFTSISLAFAIISFFGVYHRYR